MTAALRTEVRSFLADELAAGSFAPRCNAWMDGHDPAFSRKLGDRGWIGMVWPAHYGGGGRTGLDRLAVTEELLAAGAPVAAHWFADRQVGPQLLRFGTEEQRERYLPSIVKGECFFAIGMSEPEAGSDLAAVRTTAAPVSGGWRVNGRKVWTSHAESNHAMITLCRTAPVEDDRHRGLSQLIVDLHADGVEVISIPTLDEEAHFAEVVLSDVFVPDEGLLGEEGAGWAQVTSELAYERSGPERFLSVMPLLRLMTRDADTEDAERLGRIYARLIALRKLSHDVAASLDRGAASDVDAALVKDLGTVFEQETVEELRLLRRAPSDTEAGLLREAQLAAPSFTLRGGTTEVLRGIIGRMMVQA
jgi:alkylation response protein AidB-like acyl-CoA dehydrogenase